MSKFTPPDEIHPDCPRPDGDIKHHLPVLPCLWCRQLHFEDWVQAWMKEMDEMEIPVIVDEFPDGEDAY